MGYHIEEDGTSWEQILTINSYTECDSIKENYGETKLLQERLLNNLDDYFNNKLIPPVIGVKLDPI